MAFSALVESWTEALEARANGIPILFLKSWLARESGGNPCSTGFNGARDPNDGLFKFEAGIGQQFFEARSAEALPSVVVNGVSLAELRAPCSGQRQTRELTADELDANVRAFLGDVERFRAKTHAQLSAVGSQADDESLEDFWMFVKLQHALPAIPIELLRPAADSGAADSFGRFRGFIEGMTLNELRKVAPVSARFAVNKLGVFVGLGRLLDNAEKTGQGAGVSFFDFVPGATSLVGLLVPLAVLAAAAGGFIA